MTVIQSTGLSIEPHLHRHFIASVASNRPLYRRDNRTAAVADIESVFNCVIR